MSREQLTTMRVGRIAVKRKWREFNQLKIGEPFLRKMGSDRNHKSLCFKISTTHCLITTDHGTDDGNSDVLNDTFFNAEKVRDDLKVEIPEHIEVYWR